MSNNNAAKAKSNSQITELDSAPTDAEKASTFADIPTIEGSNFDETLSGKMEIVTIMSTAEEGGKDAVFVGHNGYPRQIPRDTPCKIPTEVAQGLRDAKVTTYRPGPNGSYIAEDRPRFAATYQPVPA